MKKKIFLLAVIAICVAILASGTMAYFTAEYQVHNVITTNSVDIQIEEWQDRIGNPYPDAPLAVMPGVTVSKIVTVKNLEADAYIRAKADIQLTGPDGRPVELTPETLASIITLTVNGDDWLRKDGDGLWWYYSTPVAAGTSTEPFLTEVVFDGPNMTNEYQNCTVRIIVSAQAVQTANNGTGPLTAAGWPEA